MPPSLELTINALPGRVSYLDAFVEIHRLAKALNVDIDVVAGGGVQTITPDTDPVMACDAWERNFLAIMRG